MADPPRITMARLKLWHFICQRSAINWVLLVNKHLFKESYKYHSGNFMRRGVTSSILHLNLYHLGRHICLHRTIYMCHCSLTSSALFHPLQVFIDQAIGESANKKMLLVDEIKWTRKKL